METLLSPTLNQEQIGITLPFSNKQNVGANPLFKQSSETNKGDPGQRRQGK